MASLHSWVTPELVLGILGSATGVSSLLLNLKRYLKEKPLIEAEIVDAIHRYGENPAENTRSLVLDIDVGIRNKGDKGITVGEVMIEATIGGQPLELFQEPIVVTLNLPDDEDSTARVEPHDLLTTVLTFSHKDSPDKLLIEKIIPFELSLPHADGTIKGLRGISRLTK